MMVYNNWIIDHYHYYIYYCNVLKINIELPKKAWWRRGHHRKLLAISVAMWRTVMVPHPIGNPSFMILKSPPN